MNQKQRLHKNHPSFSDYELDCVLDIARQKGVDPESLTFIGPGPWDEHGIEMTKEEYAAWSPHDKQHRYTVPSHIITLRQTSRKRA